MYACNESGIHVAFGLDCEPLPPRTPPYLLSLTNLPSASSPPPPAHHTEEGRYARYPLGTAVNIPNLSNQHKHSDLASWSVHFYRELRLRNPS